MSAKVTSAQYTIPNKTLLGTLSLGHLVNDFYGLVLPFLLPTLIVVFQMDFFAAGLVALVTNLFGGLLQPIVGYLADRYGIRKRSMIAGFLLFALGLLLVGLSTSYIMILLAWFIYGLGIATFHAQSTNYITGAFPETKGRAMGIHGIGGAIGNFSVPLVVTFLITSVDWRNTALLLAIPGLLVAVMLGKILTEAPKAQTGTMSLQVPKALWILALVAGLTGMLYSGFLTFLPTYLVEQGMSLSQVGILSTMMLFVGFFAQPGGGIVYDRIGGRWLYALSAFLTAIGLFLFTSDFGLPPLVPVVLIGAAVMATFPPTLAMASDIAKSGNVGMSVGIVFGASRALAALTPALTGYMADQFGLRLSLQWLIVFAVAAFFLAFLLPSKSQCSGS
ncbi:MFS transporter [Chloroflexi bacterium TSY]|nr:MFS transporter [Chloroflexi bacterium TSY]